MSKRPRQLMAHPVDPGIVLIPLTQGKTALISAIDGAAAAKFCWCAKRDQTTWYASTKGPGAPGTRRMLRLHRFVAELAGLDLSREIDHINGNGLDCRRENLRPATHAQNQYNRRLQKNNRSGVKGVSAMPNGRWRAQVSVNGKCVKLGCFSTIEEAAATVWKYRVALHGEFATDGLSQ